VIKPRRAKTWKALEMSSTEPDFRWAVSLDPAELVTFWQTSSICGLLKLREPASDSFA